MGALAILLHHNLLLVLYRCPSCPLPLFLHHPISFGGRLFRSIITVISMLFSDPMCSCSGSTAGKFVVRVTFCDVV